MQIQQNVPLAPFTTLRIGGPARYFAEARSEDDLLEALAFARLHALPLFPLGGGSNLVVADSGFPGLVLRLALEGGLAWTEDRRHVQVPAGFDWDRFVRIVSEQGIAGVECLAGIPGLVGGAPVQNIGAYGQEVASTIASVRAFDLHTGQFVDPITDCGFRYRHSIFNSTERNRYLITRVDFSFPRDAAPSLAYPDLQKHFAGRPTPTPLEVYHAVREIRAQKGMLIDPASPSPDSTSAGSFFKNPVVPLAALDRIASRLGISPAQIKHWPLAAHPETADPGGTVAQSIPGQTKLPAAWLIEQAGFPRGFTLGAAGISTCHTLALTNRTGTATCAELLALRDTIVAGVRQAFGITLEQEPVYLS